MVIIISGIDWTFMTVHDWGENPEGKWTLRVQDVGKGTSNDGILKEWALTLRGIDSNDYKNKQIGIKMGGKSSEGHRSRETSEESQAHVPNKSELKSIMSKEEDGANHVDIDEIYEISKEWEDDEQDEMIDALATMLLNNEADYKRKKNLVEEAIMNDNKRKQEKSINSLKRKLQSQQERRDKEEKIREQRIINAEREEKLRQQRIQEEEREELLSILEKLLEEIEA